MFKDSFQFCHSLPRGFIVVVDSIACGWSLQINSSSLKQDVHQNEHSYHDRWLKIFGKICCFVGGKESISFESNQNEGLEACDKTAILWLDQNEK